MAPWLALVASLSLTAPPARTSLQGRMAGLGGAPVDGTYGVKIAIYDDASGGEALWTASVTDLIVTDSVFDVVLDGLNPDLFSSAGSRWIGIKVGAEPELPRTEVLSAPMAIVAARALDLSCTACVSLEEAAFMPKCAAGEVLRSDGDAWACGSLDGWDDDAADDLTLASTFSGDVLGTSAALSLATTGVTAGTYTRANLSVDAKGRVLTASDGSPMDLVTDVTGILAHEHGGTGIASAGAAGNLLRSNGSTWESAPLAPADVPPGSGHYLQVSPETPQNASFDVAGSGKVGASLTVGKSFELNGSFFLSITGSTCGDKEWATTVWTGGGNGFHDIRMAFSHCGGGCHWAFRHMEVFFNGYTDMRIMTDKENNFGDYSPPVIGGAWTVVRPDDSTMVLTKAPSNSPYCGPVDILIVSNHPVYVIEKGPDV